MIQSSERQRNPWDTYREPTVDFINLLNRALADHNGVKPRPILTPEYNELLRQDIESRKLN